MLTFSRNTIAAKCITWVGRCFLKTALVEFSSKRLASLEERKIHSSFGSFSVSTTFSMALPTKPLPPVTRILCKIISEMKTINPFLWKNVCLPSYHPFCSADTVSECGVHQSKASTGKVCYVIKICTSVYINKNKIYCYRNQCPTKSRNLSSSLIGFIILPEMTFFSTWSLKATILIVKISMESCGLV